MYVHRRIQGGGGGEGALPPPPLVKKSWGLAPPPLISGNKKNMKDIINSREFQGDKGPDWLKTFHPRDVPNPSRSYCKICPLPLIQTLEHLITKKMEKAVSKLESDRLNMAVTTIEILISKIISKASASHVYVHLWTITSTS